MKLPVIRELAKTQSLDNLKAAENALIEGLPLAIEIEGADWFSRSLFVTPAPRVW